MCDLAKLMYQVAEANELLSKLADWLNDQQLVAKPAHKLIDDIRKKLAEVYTTANTPYDGG